MSTSPFLAVRYRREAQRHIGPLWFIKIFPTQAKGSLRSIVHGTFDMALGEPVVVVSSIDEHNGERTTDS